MLKFILKHHVKKKMWKEVNKLFRKKFKQKTIKMPSIFKNAIAIKNLPSIIKRREWYQEKEWGRWIWTWTGSKAKGY